MWCLVLLFLVVGSSSSLYVSSSQDDFQVTSVGYIHHSCISHNVTHASALQSDKCPRSLIPHKMKASQNSNGLQYYSNWIAYVGYLHSEEISLISSSWIVPPKPQSFNLFTTLFFFNGLEDKPHGASLILQPVLQYGYSGCGGGDFWSFTSFLVNGAGRASCGKMIKVQEGDKVTGTIERTSGSTYVITASVEGSVNDSSTLSVDMAEYSLSFACQTMEGIRIYACSAFPTNHELTFTDFKLLGNEKETVQPVWNKTVTHNECKQDVTANGDGTVTVQYSN
jgi:hypothetical protein